MFARPIPRPVPRPIRTARPIQLCPARPFTFKPAVSRTSSRPSLLTAFSSHRTSHQTSLLKSSPRLQPLFPPYQAFRWGSITTSTSTSNQRDPLHILFCGTDNFSCASLQALYNEMQSSPSSIASIQVLVRPAKPTGRGLKAISHSPVKELALQLGLPVHEQDTFTGWSCDKETNMVVAVSFGLFVPPRILRGCKYGGLNVHPSLLPDLHGASPIEHAILLGRASTGVTVQTLHERTFDGGRRLLAAPRPQEDTKETKDASEFAVDNKTTAKELRERLAPVGARLLVEVIQRGLFLPAETDLDEPKETESAVTEIQGTPAPKLSKADREVWFTPSSSVAGIDRQMRALGPVWTHIVGEKKKKLVKKRVIFEEIGIAEFTRSLLNDIDTDKEMDTLTFVQGEKEVVLPVFVDGTDVVLPLGFAVPDKESALRLRRVKIEGSQTEDAAKALRGYMRKRSPLSISWDVVGDSPDFR